MSKFTDEEIKFLEDTVLLKRQNGKPIIYMIKAPVYGDVEDILGCVNGSVFGWITGNVHGKIEGEKQVLVPLELIKAVANIGVDWGYGEYELEKHHIAKARQILAAHEQGEEND